jgi:hypothetical protein
MWYVLANVVCGDLRRSVHEGFGGLAFVGAEMMCIRLLECVWDKAALHALESSIRRRFCMGAAAQTGVLGWLGVMFTMRSCVRTCCANFFTWQKITTSREETHLSKHMWLQTGVYCERLHLPLQNTAKSQSAHDPLTPISQHCSFFWSSMPFSKKEVWFGNKNRISSGLIY